ncbi:hypothetical protein EYC80_007669 [Monilinia laxa]|uniref:Myb-like domain-containing protein n=1 Tax=Monilinia laxa TaxID=61186 RepID=A0A5N6JWM5_MONLA|nr:hypothetical protein EYC80_007669 [Monilinia laxa]
MLNWAKGLFSSQAELNSQEDPINDEADKRIEEIEVTSSFPNKDSTMDTPRESTSDQLSVADERNGTSTKKSKKSRKNKKMGGSASVLEREYQIAGSQESPEIIGPPEQNPATSPAPTSAESSRLNLHRGVEDPGLTSETADMTSSAKKEKRRRQKANHDTHADDHNSNGRAADLENQQDTIEQEDPGPKKKKKKKKKKGRMSNPGEATEEGVDQSLVDVEMQDQQEIAIATNSAAEKKERRKKRKSDKLHSSTLVEEVILQPEEPEDQGGLVHAEEKSQKPKKSKSEKAATLKTAISDDDNAQDQDESVQSIGESNSVERVVDSPAEHFHLPKSNTGKRKKLQQSIGETAIQKVDAESHVLEKSTLQAINAKKYIAKPKTSKANGTNSGDGNSVALINQSISVHKKPQLENGDIRSMFSDDATQPEVSSVTVSINGQKLKLLASAVEVADSSPAVKTSRSANEEMAGWTAADRRSGSTRNNQESSSDESEVDGQSGDVSMARRKRYLPVDEPSLLELKASKSGQKPKQKQQNPEHSSKKLGKVTKNSASEVKPKRSRSQSTTRPKDGNGRLDEKETARIADAVELYRSDNGLEQSAVNSIIQGNALTDGKKFWDFMKIEVPDVPKRNLQSWCRRNFHNYAARGVWTTEQDEELMQLFNKMPKKWTLIGAELNRLPDDCRDRWRNYLSVTNLELGPWKLEEEHQLKDSVKKCIELIREDRRREGLLTPEEEDDDTYHEHDISWMKVSELMDLSRSHLQCYRKWKSIKAREHATTDDLVAERIVISNSWKHLKSYQDASKTLAAEKLQFLRAIRDSKAGAESKIDWRAIDEKLDRNHDAMEMRICLRGLMHNLQNHENNTLQENVKLLIKAFEKSAPHEPEGYIDLPFESTGLKKRTRRSKTSSLFENNPKLYDVGVSNSKSKIRNRMLKQDESRPDSISTANTDDGGLIDTVQVPNSAKKAKRAAPSKKPSKTFALSTEKITDSDSDDGAPTSAQKPESEDEGVRKPRSKSKKAPSKNRGPGATRTDASDDEQVRQPESDASSDSDDVEMTDVQEESNHEDSDIETSPSVRFQLGAGRLSDDENDDSAYNRPPLDSDDDSEMQDSDEPQIPATPEYELREGNSKMREQSADLDESGQLYKMGESDDEEEQLQSEDEEGSHMDDMTDVPAKSAKKRAPGVSGEGDVHFGREASVDLDQ